MLHKKKDIHKDFKKALALNEELLKEFSEKNNQSYRFVIQVAKGNETSKLLRLKIEKYISKTFVKCSIKKAA